MNEYIILSDSSCDLPASIVEQQGLKIQPLVVTVDGTEYRNYSDERELSSVQFYEMLRAGKMAFTSAINVDMFLDSMTPCLQDGKDILYLGFSSALSSTYQNACIAAQELREQFPERTIRCIDSKCASMGQGLLVYLAAQKRQQGLSIGELADFVEQTTMHLCHWFTVDDLHFLKRGGRISATTASVGSILHIKPVLHVDDEGRLINVDKVRGRQAAIKSLFEKMRTTATDIGKQTIMISHGDCLADADYLAAMVQNELHPKEIIINPIGPVIGAHSGPGTLAIFFLGTQR